MSGSDAASTATLGRIERPARAGRGIELGVSLGNSTSPGGSVDRDGGPAPAALVADVDQQRVVVVLHAKFPSSHRPRDRRPGATAAATNDVQRPRLVIGR